jgi:hypothetical protein
MADQRRSGPKIDPHPLVEALVPDPSQPPERTTKLFGYPGKSPDAKSTRLWLDLDLSSYVDVPDDAIRYSKTLPDDAGTIVWVVADAPLQYGSVTSHQTQADFLSGGIATAYLGAAGPAAPGPLPTLSPCSCPPPPTRLPVCASDFAPCGFTHYPPCPPSVPVYHCPPSVPVYHCPPSVPVYHCPPSVPVYHCPPSVPIVRCPTHTVICQHSLLTPCVSHQIVCHTQTLNCPSRLIHCPSVQVICVTQPAICQNASAIVQCPTKICPSVAVPCETTPGCPLPTAGCPIGDPGGGGIVGGIG